MKLFYDNLFSANVDVLLVTTNSFVTSKHELVMGKGAAGELYKIYPFLAKKFGERILNTCGNLGKYGVIVMENIGIFQTKYHFKDNADLELIKYSTSLLRDFAVRKPELIFGLNFPGIGCGHLQYDSVYNIIKYLPDNINIYKGY
jgi:hypothetical protein